MPTINYVDLALIIFVVLSVIVGYARGLLITIVNFLRLALGFGLGFLCSNALSQPLYDSFFRARALSLVQSKIVDANGIDKTLDNLSNFISSLPDGIAGSFNLKDMDLPASKDITATIVDTMIEPVSIFLIKAVIFILVFLLFLMATGLIIRLVRSSGRNKDGKHVIRSLSKKVNHLLGALFGLAKSLVVVFGIITLCEALSGFLDTKTALYSMIDSSWVISTLSSINPFNFLTEV